MKASLHLYRHVRLIVQNASTSATEAALAMQTNEIGCVLVSDGRTVVGIVTDRDLALRIVGAGRDPRTTSLREIMSSPAALLDVDAPHEDALRLMRERGIRRVPLIAGRRVVGMVTLDDLLLERTATLDELVDIVRAQIAEGGPAQTRRFDEWRSLERRYARALTTWKGLVAKLQATSKLETRDRAEKAIELVLGSIVRRVEPAVAKKMIARAPALVQPRLRALPPGPDLSVTRASLEREMAAALDVQRSRGASIVDAVGAVLAGSGSLEASDSIGRHLPLDLRSLLRSRSVKRASVVARRPLHRVASRRARHGAGV